MHVTAVVILPTRSWLDSWIDPKFQNKQPDVLKQLKCQAKLHSFSKGFMNAVCVNNVLNSWEFWDTEQNARMVRWNSDQSSGEKNIFRIQGFQISFFWDKLKIFYLHGHVISSNWEKKNISVDDRARVKFIDRTIKENSLGLFLWTNFPQTYVSVCIYLLDLGSSFFYYFLTFIFILRLYFVHCIAYNLDMKRTICEHALERFGIQRSNQGQMSRVITPVKIEDTRGKREGEKRKSSALDLVVWKLEFRGVI